MNFFLRAGVFQLMPPNVGEDLPAQAAETEAGSIRCQRWLCGLLNHYCRRAA
jgi:hypothetical protein